MARLGEINAHDEESMLELFRKINQGKDEKYDIIFQNDNIFSEFIFSNGSNFWLWE